MVIRRIHSYDEYRAHCERMAPVHARRRDFERRLQPAERQAFTVPGFSYPAGEQVEFAADFAFAHGNVVNWREWLVCPITGLNNRQRAAVQLTDSELGLLAGESVYITEQVTPLYSLLQRRHLPIVGSEFLGNAVPLGERNAHGVRNEDLTQLTFSDESFDAVLSFDCFEHMPDFSAGIREVSRVVKSGGRLMWSVPFRADREANLLRASLGSDGEVLHHEPAEYHGDPINSAGCLCFTHFGWEMLGQVEKAGFREAYAVAYWSDIFGYLGVEQLIFIAIK